ncbi:UNVERIFIED_CONTAM: hypothetical protein FKN15_053663 [Acipenser sinensis]
MVGLQCEKKRSADGTRFGGQRVFIFAASKSVWGGSGSAHRYHPCADSGWVKTNTRCPPKRVPLAVRFFTHCRLTMQPPRATATEDNAVLDSLQASPQAPGQTTGVAGAQ